MLAQNNKINTALKSWEPEKTAIVIPCYNEARRLPLDAFLNLTRERDDIRLVFVDDGSKDETISLLCAAMAALPDKVDVLLMKQNGGKAEAVRQGLKYASGRGHKYVAFLDADLATPMDAVLDFASVADRMDEIDVVFGSRKGGLGHKVHRDFSRKIISLICATMGRLATGLPIQDTQCGAKLFRNTPQFRRSLTRAFSAGWLFDVELFLRVSHPDRKKRDNFFEFPVIEWTEVPGSKIKSSDVLKSGLKMLALIINQWRIRDRYFKRASEDAMEGYQMLRCGETLTKHILDEVSDHIDNRANGLVLDLSNVKTLAPSIFTTLIKTCDDIERSGMKLKVWLPDDEDITLTALQTGFASVFECVRVSTRSEIMPNHARFDMVEV